ncbi:MAG TPA: elongation factor P [Thermodesulfobacteriota bacterium]|nr:elongation factor P [Thermodesulfobacteriota bacterium]
MGVSVSTADFRKQLKIELEGEPFVIIDFQHVKPGKGGAFVRTKLKSLKTGRVLDRTFRSGEVVPTPDLDEREVQFLYRQDDQFCFMDTSTYEQLFLDAEQVGDAAKWLTENLAVRLLFHQGRPLSIELPITVNLRIVRTEPGIRGDTAAGGSKPATLETGAVVQVPLFLNEGDVVKVDTRTGEYVERVK